MNRDAVLQDPYWKAVADFILGRSPAETVYGPEPLRPLLGKTLVAYDEQDLDGTVRFVAIHKGLLDEIGLENLEIIQQQFRPVFANEVFVLYDRTPPPSERPLSEENIHLVPLQEKLNALKMPALSPKGDPGSTRHCCYLGDHLAITRLANGLNCYIDTRDRYLVPRLLLDGYADAYLTSYFDAYVKTSQTVVDVGANIGYYSLLLAHRVGRKGKILAFEANPQLGSLIYRNFEANSYQDRLTVVNKVVADKTGFVVLNTVGGYPGSSTIGQITDAYAQKHFATLSPVEVESVTLDAYFGADIPRIDVLKIDVEGSEAHVLRGARKVLERQEKILVFCEFNPPLLEFCGTRPLEFLQELRSYGFIIQTLDLAGKLTTVPDAEIMETCGGAHVDLVLTRGREPLRSLI